MRMATRLLSLLLWVLVSCPLHGTCYYVSSSQGSDSHDGLSELTPKKSLAGIPRKDVTIRFKCGDVFWGGISGYTDCCIESYGKGARPVICGFKVLIKPQAWRSLGNGRWVLDLSNDAIFAGNVAEYDKEINNVGFIYDAWHDRLYGRRVMSPDSLRREMDFYTSDYFKTVVVKSLANPLTLGNLCFPTYQSGVERMSNCSIRGLAIVGFSKMGMERLSNCIVEDCQIDLIGGAIQIGHNKLARYGNGIELWDNCCGNTIKNCLISRTYDCATTIQANGKVMSDPRDNRFIGNRIYKCRQAFEHFINPDDGSLRQYVNCEFSENYCYNMGDNEFGCPEARDCNILSYENLEKPITIKDNVFFGANHLDGTGISTGMSGNTVYLFQDQYLYTRHWADDKRTIFSHEERAVERFKKMTRDESRIVILKRGSLRAKMIEMSMRRRINWTPVDLHLEQLLTDNGHENTHL